MTCYGIQNPLALVSGSALPQGGLLGLRLKAAEMFPLRLRLVYSYLQPVVAHFHYQHAAFALSVERRDTVGRSLGC